MSSDFPPIVQGRRVEPAHRPGGVDTMLAGQPLYHEPQ